MSELMADLLGAGEVEGRGGFSIDAEKAREKLRQYQLANPRDYVLLLVEAAVLAGAEALAFEIDSDDVHLRFSAEPFDQSWLENIYGALFVDPAEVAPEALESLRAAQQLAFAVNSAMALNPRWLRVQSVGSDGEGTLLELRPDVEDRVEALSGAEPGTHIHVRDRFRPGLVIEFFRHMRGNIAEATILREACRWSRAPVHINGDRISDPAAFVRGRDSAGAVQRAPVVLDGEVVGEVYLGLCVEGTRELAPPKVHLLANGVSVETEELDGCVEGFGALVDARPLRRDVSQTRLLRDDAFEAVLGAVVEAHDQLLARLVSAWVDGSAGDDPPEWLEAACFDWWRRRGYRRSQLRKFLDSDELFAAIARAPIWPAVGAKALSTEALIRSRWPVRFSSQDFEFAPLDVPFVVYADGETERLLEHMFGSQCDDYTEVLAREQARQLKRLEFMSRTHFAELPDVRYWVTHAIEGSLPARKEEGQEKGREVTGHAIRGEVGFLPGSGDSWVRLVTQGCLLDEITLEEGLPGMRAVVSTRLVPAPTYDRAEPDLDLGRALVAVLAGVEAAVAKLAAGFRGQPVPAEIRKLFQLYIERAAESDYERAFLDAFGLSRSQARRSLSRSRDLVTRPDWKLGGAPEDYHPLAHVPLFRKLERGREGFVSVAELVAEREAGRRVAWLPDSAVMTASMAASIEHPVVILTKAEREQLRPLVGDRALESFQPQLTALRRRQEFLDRPSTTPTLGSTLIAVPFAVAQEDAGASAGQGAIPGALGLRRFDLESAVRGDMAVSVVIAGRELASFDLVMPLPGLRMWIQGDLHHTQAGLLRVREDWSGLHDAGGLRVPVFGALVDLVEKLCERLSTSPRDAVECEWWLALMVPALVLGRGGLHRLFLELRRERGLEAACAELMALLALLERYPERDLERVAKRLRKRSEDGETPGAAAIEAALKRPTARVSPEERALALLRQGLVPATARILELPVLRGFVGGRCEGQRRWSLSQIIDHVASDEPLAWVSDTFIMRDPPTVDFAIVALSAVELRLLERIFDVRALDEVSDWLEGRAKFERRARVHDRSVPRRRTLNVLPIDGRLGKLGPWPAVRGEVGLVWDERQTRTEVCVYTEGREVSTFTLQEDLVPLSVAIEIDGLELNDEHDAPSQDDYRRIVELVRGWQTKLIDSLALTYDELAKTERANAAALVRRLLRRWPPGSGSYRSKSSRDRRRFEALAALPAFPGARRPWSADELAEAVTSAPIATLEYRISQELPDRPVIVLERPDIEPCLRALFGRTTDLSAVLARRRAAAMRKQNAAELVLEPPREALAELAVEEAGLRGWLAIVPGRNVIAVGEDGRRVQVVELSGNLPVCGSIWSASAKAIHIDEDWKRATWTKLQRRTLAARAFELWVGLAERYRELLDSPPIDSPGRRRFAATRRTLRDLFLRLHMREGRAYQRRVKKGKGPANTDQELYARCLDLPLLELSNGRWISAETAARERPIELADLELWRGPSAEEMAEQRAREAREAERRREEAKRRREQRERYEAERRRELERARQREAKRKREAREAAAKEARRQREQAKERAREQAAAKEAKRKAERAQKSKGKGKGKRGRRKAEPPTPEALLLEALRAELRLVRGKRTGLISERHLESLELHADGGRRAPLFARTEDGPRLNTEHALFGAVLASYANDPGALTLLASSAYTFLNIVYTEIEDEDEAEFLRAHAAYAETSMRS